MIRAIEAFADRAGVAAARADQFATHAAVRGIFCAHFVAACCDNLDMLFTKALAADLAARQASGAPGRAADTAGNALRRTASAGRTLFETGVTIGLLIDLAHMIAGGTQRAATPMTVGEAVGTVA